MVSENQDNKRKSQPTESSKTDKSGEVYYKKTKANSEVIAQGMEIINALNDVEKRKIRSKKDTLHFIALLGLASKKTNSNLSRRKVSTEHGIEVKVQTKQFPTAIGVRLKTDIEIERVPFLKNEEDENGRNKVTKNKYTGINPEEDFEYKTIKAGEIFDLTLYEFMFLIIRDEYGGYLRVFGEDFYAHLSVKLPAFWRGDAKLPTPTINFEKGMGSARTFMIDIDVKQNGKWSVKPEFTNRFKPIFEIYQSKKKTRNRNRVNDKNINNPDNDGLNLPYISLLSLALYERLSMSESNTLPKVKDLEDLTERGKEIFLSMDESQKKLLGSKSSTLHIINVLGYEKNYGALRHIGLTLISDEEVNVPVIDIAKDIKTGINRATDINYRTVPAGESFVVSNYEFMYLVLRDEYVGFCEFDRNNQGAFLLPNLKLYFDGKNKLPVPNIKFSDGKTPSMVDIHQTTEYGVKEIKPEYSIKFGALLEKG